MNEICSRSFGKNWEIWNGLLQVVVISALVVRTGILCEKSNT